MNKSFKIDIANASGEWVDVRTIAWPSYGAVTAITNPPTYIWRPRKSITVYELALCLPFLFSGNPTGIEKLPKKARRHFVHEVVED